MPSLAALRFRYIKKSLERIDIDVAVATYGQLPRAQLAAAGFVLTGRFSHLENWVGPDDAPVQFMDDPALAETIPRAEEIV